MIFLQAASMELVISPLMRLKQLQMAYCSSRHLGLMLWSSVYFLTRASTYYSGTEMIWPMWLWYFLRQTAHPPASFHTQQSDTQKAVIFSPCSHLFIYNCKDKLPVPTIATPSHSRSACPSPLLGHKLGDYHWELEAVLTILCRSSTFSLQSSIDLRVLRLQAYNSVSRILICSAVMASNSTICAFSSLIFSLQSLISFWYWSLFSILLWMNWVICARLLVFSYILREVSRRLSSSIILRSDSLLVRVLAYQISFLRRFLVFSCSERSWLSDLWDYSSLEILSYMVLTVQSYLRVKVLMVVSAVMSRWEMSSQRRVSSLRYYSQSLRSMVGEVRSMPRFPSSATWMILEWLSLRSFMMSATSLRCSSASFWWAVLQLLCLILMTQSSLSSQTSCLLRSYVCSTVSSWCSTSYSSSPQILFIFMIYWSRSLLWRRVFSSPFFSFSSSLSFWMISCFTLNIISFSLSISRSTSATSLCEKCIFFKASSLVSIEYCTAYSSSRQRLISLVMYSEIFLASFVLKVSRMWLLRSSSKGFSCLTAWKLQEQLASSLSHSRMARQKIQVCGAPMGLKMLWLRLPVQPKSLQQSMTTSTVSSSLQNLPQIPFMKMETMSKKILVLGDLMFSRVMTLVCVKLLSLLMTSRILEIMRSTLLPLFSGLLPLLTELLGLKVERIYLVVSFWLVRESLALAQVPRFCMVMLQISLFWLRLVKQAPRYPWREDPLQSIFESSARKSQI